MPEVRRVWARHFWKPAHHPTKSRALEITCVSLSFVNHRTHVIDERDKNLQWIIPNPNVYIDSLVFIVYNIKITVWRKVGLKQFWCAGTRNENIFTSHKTNQWWRFWDIFVDIYWEFLALVLLSWYSSSTVPAQGSFSGLTSYYGDNTEHFRWHLVLKAFL